MRRNPANESVVEFVVTVRNSMLAAAEVMGAAETAVGMGYAKDFTVRVISEGASPALGIRFIYDSSDNVLDRAGKITRILEKGGGHVAGSSHARRNPEGERHTSLKEQAESALLWERIRNAKSRKEALAHYRAALLAAENEQRLLRDRKKAGKGRKPKPVYTKEYLAKKGMPRRNPLEMYRRPGDLFSVSIPFTTSTPLSVEFSKTDPGEQRRFRLLPNSPKEAGWLKPIIGKWLSADDALDLAVEAEGLSKNMYSSYPRHEYRDAARFYEGMSVVFFGLAEAVQTPWGR